MSETETERRSMSIVERAIALRGADAFRHVPTEQLAYLAAVAREASYDAGHVLFDEGDLPEAMYVILSGTVAVSRGEELLGSTCAGEALGTWSLLDEHPRRAAATVVEDARVLVLDREDFFEVLSEHVGITRSLLRDLVRRLRALAE